MRTLHPLLAGTLGALLLFNGAPRCIPAANMLLNISHLIDADHADDDKPRSRVHCEELRDEDTSGAKKPVETFPDEDNCRCRVVAESLA